MDENQVNELLTQSVDDIVRTLAAAQPAAEDLAALRAAEAAGKNRSTLLAEFDRLIAAAGKDDTATATDDVTITRTDDDAADDTGADKVERGEERPEPPAWKLPAYSGPLTADQAAWRNQHITLKDRDAPATK